MNTFCQITTTIPLFMFKFPNLQFIFHFFTKAEQSQSIISKKYLNFGNNFTTLTEYLISKFLSSHLSSFNSLMDHAVPLDEKAVGALHHSAMGLDIYAWLAQRLHRVSPKKPQFVTWAAIKDQFGWHYGQMNNFKRVFRKTLETVLSQYKDAKLYQNDKGLTLCNSPTPVKRRDQLVTPRKK